VWQRLIGLFVGNSIPIKLMDKSSGLIQSERLGLGSHYALKHADDSLAWALCETVRSPEGDSFYLFPQVINGELQVYVQEMVDGKTLLSVNLMNLKATYRDLATENEREYMIESTKRLENLIGNYLKTYERMPSLNFDPPSATFGEAPSQVARRARLEQERLTKIYGTYALNKQKWKEDHQKFLEEAEKEEARVEKNKQKWYVGFGIAFITFIVLLRVFTN
jgi:fructose-1,6-bisphosphatase